MQSESLNFLIQPYIDKRARIPDTNKSLNEIVNPSKGFESINSIMVGRSVICPQKKKKKKKKDIKTYCCFVCFKKKYSQNICHLFDKTVLVNNIIKSLYISKT